MDYNIQYTIYDVYCDECKDNFKRPVINIPSNELILLGTYDVNFVDPMPYGKCSNNFKERKYCNVYKLKTNGSIYYNFPPLVSSYYFDYDESHLTYMKMYLKYR